MKKARGGDFVEGVPGDEGDERLGDCLETCCFLLADSARFADSARLISSCFLADSARLSSSFFFADSARLSSSFFLADSARFADSLDDFCVGTNIRGAVPEFLYVLPATFILRIGDE